MSRAESSASCPRRAATRRRALKRNYHAQATYGTNAGLWAHPYGPVAAEGLWAHVDRVGVRVPDAAGKKRALQRSLTPHLDCCPDRLHAGGGKRFPRWRPIQCFLALDDALEALNAGPADDQEPEDARSADAEAALDLLTYDEMDRQEEADVDERLGVVMSHELIEVDDDGDPVTTATRHVFVDEVTCIGCTSCATIAPLTFLMEDAHGRARSFNQEGDDDDTVAEAIATCPVDCIHYVPWDELVKLEREREGVMTTYNFKGRLVGNEGLTSTQGAGRALLDISTNHAMRCQNCPTNQCPDCPMFAVSTERRTTRCGNCPSNGCANCPIASKYPEFQKKRARRERKRRELCGNQFVAARLRTHCLICLQAGN